MKPQDTPQGPTLIQFATENSMANLLPLMALKPSRILHIGGGSDKVRFLVQAVSQEAEYKGWQPKIMELPVNKPMREIADIREFMATTLLANPGAMLNLSGASQLMGIGAYQAAQVFGRATMFCEPEAERFVDGQTGRFARLPDYREAAKRLSVRLMMAARGKNLSDWRGEQASDALRAFGLKAFELRNKNWNALEHFNKGLRAHFYGPGDKLPATPEELVALLGKPLPAALCQNDASKALLTAAASAGLTKEEGQSFRLLGPAVNGAVERTVQVLMSRWIELAVLDCVLRNPRYKDVHWGLTPQAQQSSESQESDILCIDQETSSLRLISCKATINRSPQDHLEAMSSRAGRLGATASTFVLFKPAQGQESAIRGAARRLGINVALEADEIVKSFAPSAK